jgi:hypothetical protein
MLHTPNSNFVTTPPVRKISGLSLNRLNARARAQLVADIVAGRVVIDFAQLIEQSIAKAEEIVNRSIAEQMSRKHRAARGVRKARGAK